MQLICPAGSLPSLRAAIDHGADAVYVGFRDETNARAFPGLNFDDSDLRAGIAYAHARQRKVYMALNTYPTPIGLPRWEEAVDRAADLGADVLIVAEMAVLEYATKHYPQLPRHLSVQGSATTRAALQFYYEEYGIARAVLPRVLAIQQVERLAEKTPVPLETFAFGSLCIMVEGRCQLSSYTTGVSPNRHGVCSPASHVRWGEESDGRTARLNNVLIDKFADNEPAGYPVVCKGRYYVNGQVFHALEEPTSLNTLDLLPRLTMSGIAALKIEGRQRSPAYVATVTGVWRKAIDRVMQMRGSFHIEKAWQKDLSCVAEGTQTTLGPYHRPWQ